MSQLKEKITLPAPFLEKTIEDLDFEMRSSVHAYWHLMKLCFPHMRGHAGAGSKEAVRPLPARRRPL